jgi:hypothetical protein
MKITRQQYEDPQFEEAIKTVVLNVFREKLQTTLSGHILRNYDIDVVVDNFTDSLVASVKTNLLGEHQKPYVYHTYTSWWDHFKDTIKPQLPKWLQKKIIVHKKKHELTIDTIYPLLDIAIPEDRYDNTVTILVANQNVGTRLSHQPKKNGLDMSVINQQLRR